jgi:hypothetical protein
LIVASLAQGKQGDDDDDVDMEFFESRTDLDSHANMCVAGKYAFVLADSGTTATVRAFSPDMDAIETSIVDCAFRYDCTYTNKTYILVAHNALYVPTMDHNLIPPFLLREAGLIVNETPKIHVPDPDISDHSIYFEQAKLRIPLALWGIFSYFPTQRPTVKDLQSDYNEVLLITPDGPWNPNTDVYARNEENMLDHLGNITEPAHRPRILLDDIQEDYAMAASLCISSLEALHLDTLFENCSIIGDDNNDIHTPMSDGLSDALCERSLSGQFRSSIGATHAHPSDTLFPEIDTLEDEHLLSLGDLDLDEFFEYMISSTEAVSKRGVTAEQLSKVWSIDMSDAQRTIDATTQLCVQSKGDSLTRNYATNDRMLR